jgi:hypothetical protein
MGPGPRCPGRAAVSSERLDPPASVLREVGPGLPHRAPGRLVAETDFSAENGAEPSDRSYSPIGKGTATHRPIHDCP